MLNNIYYLVFSVCVIILLVVIKWYLNIQIKIVIFFWKYIMKTYWGQQTLNWYNQYDAHFRSSLLDLFKAFDLIKQILEK